MMINRLVGFRYACPSPGNSGGSWLPMGSKWAGWQRLDEVSGVAAFPGGATKAFGSDFSKM